VTYLWDNKHGEQMKNAQNTRPGQQSEIQIAENARRLAEVKAEAHRLLAKVYRKDSDESRLVHILYELHMQGEGFSKELLQISGFCGK